jgi:hypothetical protein
MGNVAHTPGPWEHDESGGLVPGSHEWHVYANSAPVGKRLPAICDSEANARLIAAAPELLAALQLILDDYDNGYDTVLQFKAVDATRAAIAKATGNA